VGEQGEVEEELAVEELDGEREVRTRIVKRGGEEGLLALLVLLLI
jgi:hypothetical protein